jgi:hypothetical protein
MKIKEVLSLLENKKDWHTADQYSRKWNSKTGLWEYAHRKKLGLGPGSKDKVVHHKNGNIKDNRPSNLEVVSRAKHAALGKPALKHTKCKKCGKSHFGLGLCRTCYARKYEYGKKR